MQQSNRHISGRTEPDGLFSAQLQQPVQGKAIDEWCAPKMLLPHLLRPYLPSPRQRPFWLLMVDVTAQPRPYGHTVEDRSMVYQPTVVSGNKPVAVGHQYSSVVLGLEPEAGVTDSWVLPLLTQRVASHQDKELVGRSA